jgi:hypothetical protein
MILSTDFESNQEKINTLLSDKIVVESLKKDVAQKVGYSAKTLKYINCITVGEFFFCGPIIGVNSTTIYFDAISDGRLIFYFSIGKHNGRVSLIINDTSVDIEPLYVIRMFKFMTLLLNTIGVRRKDLILLTKVMVSRFLPKNWFCHDV